ncbi:MAG: hypothetical protein M3082_14920 [Candidatus Dormibacteraeota bacterium]|nr:hypothetical protein [Candidatus Dormibacteraeota bacterium]
MSEPPTAIRVGSEFDLSSIDVGSLTADMVLTSITITDPDALDEAIELAVRAYEDEEKRTATIESKATTIIAALGIAASVILGASGLLLNNADKLRLIPIWVLIVLLIPYVAALGFFSFALQTGMQAARVGFMARPDPGDIVRLQAEPDESRVGLKQTYLASLLVSYERNRRANNDKAGNLQAGHEYFLRAAACLMAGAVAVMIVVIGIRLTLS